MKYYTLHYFAVVACAVVSLGFADEAFDKVAAKIVDGTIVPHETKYPFMASLLRITSSKKMYRCGASIISEYYLITATHCVNEADSKYEVYIGSLQHGKGIPKIVVERIYSPNSHDLALLKVAEKIVFTDTVQPIKLVRSGCQRAIGEKLTVIGWGDLDSDGTTDYERLREVEATVVNCNYKGENSLGNDQLCYTRLDGKDNGVTCEGDSGGPAISNGVLYGVVHAEVIPTIDDKHCTGIGTAASTNVAYYQDFIISNTDLTEDRFVC